MADISDSSARASAELQELLLSTSEFEEFLDDLSVIAATALGEAYSCGITVARDGRPLTVSSSDARASRVDEVQYGNDTGPCLHSMRTGETVLIDDLATDERWTEYRTIAMAEGIRSSLSTPLGGDSLVKGALNLYAEQPFSFGVQERTRAARFAAEASRALTLATRLAAQAELSEHLRAALASRSVIDQAIGAVMAQNRCAAGEAFQILRAASQHRNVKLREVATEIVTAIGGKAPEAPRFE